ncbi:uncharacterized protein AtWU_09121 [Aspergillus tubingensis]|uniref:uncharacterized protein n=1 Tax=Aspergillus tubingensis TaxID=5068 RepID=UPI001577D98D|nr:uncharacterized protein AtWU_09121 [Aspergillus tubingensis]GFN19317.1 hypothetical protein AtWU_09121 [Aspergillus tubingensis]
MISITTSIITLYDGSGTNPWSLLQPNASRSRRIAVYGALFSSINVPDQRPLFKRHPSLGSAGLHPLISARNILLVFGRFAETSDLRIGLRQTELPHTKLRHEFGL